MNRRHFAFACEGDMLAATLDDASGSSGLLIVSGGNEVRAGAFAGQAQLAATVAEAGFPVFRFDRRGVGDSEGDNRGFRASGPDIAAAIATFRAAVPQLRRLVALGNCDAASALMLEGGAGADFLLLSNPWTIEQDESDGENGTHAPDAVRARYAEKLRNPKELLRLVTGQVDLGKLARGIRQALLPRPAPTSLAQEMAARLAASGTPCRILLAGNDRTAQLFAAHWQDGEADIRRCEDASHAYVEPHARQWLREQVLEVLRG